MKLELRELRFPENGSNLPKKSAGLGIWFICVGYKENHSSFLIMTSPAFTENQLYMLQLHPYSSSQ